MSELKRRRYDAEFKRNAIALANEPGRSVHSVENSLGIAQGLISRWCTQLKKESELAFPGKGVVWL